LIEGIGAAVEQRHPVIVGANVHAALVDADLGRRLDRRFVVDGCAVVGLFPE
jgi:hypothetical protein